MATNLTEWAPHIEARIQGVPDPALKLAVREAAREFCEQTLLWTYALARINVAVGTSAYTLTVPAGQYGEIVGVDNAKFKRNGLDDDQFVTLDPISRNQEDLHNSGDWPYAESSAPTHFYVNDDDLTTINLYPIPTLASTSGLLVRVNLRPTSTCTTVPDFLYANHKKTIAAGAVAWLLGLEGMPWYNPQASLMRQSEFRLGYNSAKARKITGGTKRELTVRMRPFI